MAGALPHMGNGTSNQEGLERPMNVWGPISPLVRRSFYRATSPRCRLRMRMASSAL